MDFAHRRDAFVEIQHDGCFEQYKKPYTVFPPHVVHPLSKEFAENLRDFATVCVL